MCWGARAEGLGSRVPAPGGEDHEIAREDGGRAQRDPPDKGGPDGFDAEVRLRATRAGARAAQRADRAQAGAPAGARAQALADRGRTVCALGDTGARRTGAAVGGRPDRDRRARPPRADRAAGNSAGREHPFAGDAGPAAGACTDDRAPAGWRRGAGAAPVAPRARPRRVPGASPPDARGGARRGPPADRAGRGAGVGRRRVRGARAPGGRAVERGARAARDGDRDRADRRGRRRRPTSAVGDQPRRGAQLAPRPARPRTRAGGVRGLRGHGARSVG